MKVVFVSTVFGEVNCGPAVYANHLWKYFSQHSEVEFFLVVPKSNLKHKRIFESGDCSNSRVLYKTLQQKALEVASKIGSADVIIHGNNSHSMSLTKTHPGPVIGQINDYCAAKIYQNAVAHIRRYGLRRFLSLAYRNYHERDFVRFADVILCNSEFLRKEIEMSYFVPNTTSLKTIYKAINFDSFAMRKGGDRRLTHLLFVGSNWILKGLDTAVKSLAKLPRSLDYMQLNVAGYDPVNAQKIHKLVLELGLEKRVIFHGQVGETKLKRLLETSAAFILPAASEALGVAVIEAISSGVPVVASGVGGLPEIITGTKASKIVESRPEEIAGQIDRLVNNYPSLETLNHDRSMLRMKFSRDEMIENVTQVYRSLS